MKPLFLLIVLTTFSNGEQKLDGVELSLSDMQLPGSERYFKSEIEKLRDLQNTNKAAIEGGNLALIDMPGKDKLVSVSEPSFLSPEVEKEALRELKATYERAIAEGNLSIIEPYLAEDFTAVMITADEVSDYEGIKAYWKKVTEFIGEDGTYTVSIEPDDTIFEGNIAIAKGTAREHVVRGGKEIDLISKWTAIARKEGNSWKLVRIQASVDPVNNPIVTALGKTKLWITGAIATICGLLIGWLLGKRKAR